MDPLKVIIDPAFRNKFKGKNSIRENNKFNEIILQQVWINFLTGKHQASEIQPSIDIANASSGSHEISAVDSSVFREQMLSTAKDFKVPQNFEVEFFKSIRLSIQMDFSEAINEITINSTILGTLKNFFTTENPFDLKVLLWDISKLI